MNSPTDTKTRIPELLKRDQAAILQDWARQQRLEGRRGEKVPEAEWREQAILAHQNSSRVRRDPQNVRIVQSSQSRVGRGLDFNFRRDSPQPAVGVWEERRL